MEEGGDEEEGAAGVGYCLGRVGGGEVCAGEEEGFIAGEAAEVEHLFDLVFFSD